MCEEFFVAVLPRRHLISGALPYIHCTYTVDFTLYYEYRTYQVQLVAQTREGWYQEGTR